MPIKKVKSKTSKVSTLISIVMGSRTDLSVMKAAAQVLKEFKVPHEVLIRSAHRTPHEMAKFAEGAQSRGIRVIIAGAGGAAHLPGMIAAHTPLPVIGVPVPVGALQGQDALLSIAQMPAGIPVATVAIGGAANAALLALQILAFGGQSPDPSLAKKLELYRARLRKKVLKTAKRVSTR